MAGTVWGAGELGGDEASRYGLGDTVLAWPSSGTSISSERSLSHDIESSAVNVAERVSQRCDGSFNGKRTSARPPASRLAMAGELWLISSDIPEYTMGNRLNHKPKRPRKLLLHKREIAKFAGKAQQRGFTLVPLRMYFKQGRAKVELGVARGKQQHDKRQDQKKAEAQRDIRRAMTDRRRS